MIKRNIFIYIFSLIYLTSFCQNVKKIKKENTQNNCYSTITNFIEKEIQAKTNKNIKISSSFFYYYNLIEQAKYIYKTGFSKTKITKNPDAFSAIKIIVQYGFVTDYAYYCDLDLINKLYNNFEKYIKSLKKEQFRSEIEFTDTIKKYINKQINYPPNIFIYNNIEYTASDFRNSFYNIKFNDYYCFLFNKKSKLYDRIEENLVENWPEKFYYNIPKKEDSLIINYSISNKYPVYVKLKNQIRYNKANYTDLIIQNSNVKNNIKFYTCLLDNYKTIELRSEIINKNIKYLIIDKNGAKEVLNKIIK